MFRKRTALVMVALLVVLAACAQPAPEVAPQAGASHDATMMPATCFSGEEQRDL